MIDYYVLNKQGEPVRCKGGLMEWAQFLSKGPRVVKQEWIGNAQVSTVFLGLDHNFMHKGPPILWECMVFSNDRRVDGFADRCAGVREQAEAMHAKMVARVKRAQRKKVKK